MKRDIDISCREILYEIILCKDYVEKEREGPRRSGQGSGAYP